MVYQYVFSGTTYIVGARMGERGWILVGYGTDASTVINLVFAAPRPIGARVFFMKGLYNLTAQLVTGTQYALSLIGECLSWTGPQGVVLKATVAMSCIMSRAGGGPDDMIPSWFDMERICLDGNNLADWGVVIGGRDSAIRLSGFAGFRAGGAAIRSHCEGLWIDHNWIENNPGRGIDEIVDLTWITNNHFYNNAQGDIRVGQYSSPTNIWILNNRDTGGSSYFVYFDDNYSAVNIWIKNNTLRNLTTAAIYFKGLTAITHSHIRIIDNRLDGNAATADFVSVPANVTIVNGKARGNTIINITNLAFNEVGSWFDKKDNYGFNPYGIIATPFDNVNNRFGYPAGGAAAPANANTDYVCIGVDCMMSVTGGTGVSVTLKSPASALIYTYGAPPVFIPNIPIGFIVNFGNFSAAPTVVVSGN
jgi:hypothetical protein